MISHEHEQVKQAIQHVVPVSPNLAEQPSTPALVAQGLADRPITTSAQDLTQSRILRLAPTLDQSVIEQLFMFTLRLITYLSR